MPQDWSLYENEITRLYLKEGKTARYTIEFLNKKHNCGITQFKSKFGGLKNIQAKEWKAVGDEIRTRKSQGKSSDVYLYNRLQDPSRVDREMKRYDNHVSGMEQVTIDLGIETIDQHRIEIRSPVTDQTKSSPNLNTNERRNREVTGEIQDHNILRHSAEYFQPSSMTEISYEINIQRQGRLSPLPLSPTLFDITGIVNINGMQNSTPKQLVAKLPDGYASKETYGLNGKPRVESPKVSTRSHQYFDQPLDAEFDILGDNSVLWNPKPSYRLFWNDPGIFPMFLNLNCTTISIFEREAHSKVEKNPNWLFSRLADITPNIPGMQALLEHIQQIIPPKPRKTNFHSPLDYRGLELLHSVFSVVAYLASNNLLEEIQLQNFVKWIIDSRHISALSKFMGIKCLNLDTFIATIIRTACPLPSFGSLFEAPGKYYENDKHAKSLFLTHPSESLNLTRVLSRRNLSGSLGTHLLIAATDSGHEEAMKLLIDNGASVDGNPSGNPLTIAAARGHTVILKHIIAAGANLNAKVLDSTDSSLEKDPWTTPVAVTVYHGQLELLAALLEAGAKVDVMTQLSNGIYSTEYILDFSKRRLPQVHELLVNHLALDEISEAWFMVEQAQKGDNALADFLMKRGIVQNERIQRGLYYAATWGKTAAVRTLLHRRADVTTRKACNRATDISGSDNETSDGSCPLLATLNSNDRDFSSVIYLLVKAGRRINKLPDLRSAFTYNHLRALILAGHDMSKIGPSVLENIPLGFEYFGIILDLSCPIDEYGPKGKSALQIAASHLGSFSQGHCENGTALVQYLIDRGADVNFAASENGGRTALQSALEEANYETVDCLLGAGADVMVPPAKTGGITTMEAAARGFHNCRISGWYERIYVDNLRCRKLEQATETFRKLLALGAQVTRADGDGGELLHRLIVSENYECLELTLEAGAAANGPSFEFEPNTLGSHTLTPLQFAAWCSDMKAMLVLLKYGANVNAPAASIRGLSAIQAAATELPRAIKKPSSPTREAQYQVAEFLLEYGADVNAAPADKYGRTALQAACSPQVPNHQLVRLLFYRNPNINSEPARVGGVTALQGAAIQGDIPLVKLLLQKGADINARASEKEGRIAVEGAAEHGRLDMLKLLLNEGALPNSFRGFSGAIDLAKKNEHWAIVDLLEGHQNQWLGPFIFM